MVALITRCQITHDEGATAVQTAVAPESTDTEQSCVRTISRQRWVLDSRDD